MGAERRYEHETREALIKKLLAEQSARWAHEDDKKAETAMAQKRAETNAREARIDELLAEEHAQWAAEDALAERTRKEESDSRERLIARLTAEEEARWEEEDTAKAAACRDVQLVMQQAECTKAQAEEALEANHGDVINAIQEILEPK